MKLVPSVASLVFVVVFSGSATAAALDILIRLLIPVFLAQNFSSLCLASDPKFLSELPAPRYDVASFTEHFKDHITAGLTHDEAKRVVAVAANTARQAAREEIRKISPQYPAVAPEVIGTWCQTQARAYVLAVMNKHYDEHDEFLRIMELAKRQPPSASVD